MSLAKSHENVFQSLLTNRLWALSIALFILLLDFATKAFVHQNLPVMSIYTDSYPYGGIPIFHNFLGIEFSISHATNKGAAWGLFSDYQSLLLGLRIVLVAGLSAYFWNSLRHPSWRIPLALVLAGAIGNIIDSFFYGHVVDMLHFVIWGYNYPVFNVADSAIFVGVSSLIIASWFEKS